VCGNEWRAPSTRCLTESPGPPSEEQTSGFYSPNVVEGEFSEVPIAPVLHEGGLIYRAWAMAFRSYRASSRSLSVCRSFLGWRFTARF
jgi:hypothetical protein